MDKENWEEAVKSGLVNVCRRHKDGSIYFDKYIGCPECNKQKNPVYKNSIPEYIDLNPLTLTNKSEFSLKDIKRVITTGESKNKNLVYAKLNKKYPLPIEVLVFKTYNDFLDWYNKVENWDDSIISISVVDKSKVLGV